jgi:hypothetical protein
MQKHTPVASASASRLACSHDRGHVRGGGGTPSKRTIALLNDYLHKCILHYPFPGRVVAGEICQLPWLCSLGGLGDCETFGSRYCVPRPCTTNIHKHPISHRAPGPPNEEAENKGKAIKHKQDGQQLTDRENAPTDVRRNTAL